MKKGLFITGTDTGVGKTFVVCALARLLQREGVDFGVFKPVQTGLVRGKCPDLETYRRDFRLPDPEELTIPVRLTAPQAPVIAARLEKQELFIEKIRRSFYILQKRHDNMLVEGVGGVMVPLTPGVLVADFIRMCGLPALVVARPDLGTINHTCMTVDVLRRKGVKVAGVIINKVKNPGNAVFRMVLAEIERIAGVPVLGTIGRSQPVKKSLDYGAILKHFAR